MAAVETVPNGASPDPIQLALSLPRAPQTNVHLRLEINRTSLLLFLTTAMVDESGNTAPLGSFVYALPDRLNPGQTLSTPLYTYEATLDFTTRMAKLLARKTGKPVYVGNSISFVSAGMAGVVEEEMEVFGKIVQVVMGEVDKSGVAVNGTSY